MSAAILGIGCATPLGGDWETVHKNLAAGRPPETIFLPGPQGHPSLPAYRVSAPFDKFSHPRLRRASIISHFACTAASAAVAQVDSLPVGRTALVFATSNGTAIYTRQFYENVVKCGSGSPLLFPETVYNAPASHVAAVLGIDGFVLTIVNDAIAGMDALATAMELLRSGEAEYCVVVASEEVDWVLCDGYRRWRLASAGSPPENGAILSEGAVALVIGAAAPGDVILETIPFSIAKYSSRESLEDMYQKLAGDLPLDTAILSASSVFWENIEKTALKKCFPDIQLATPNILAGQAFSASTLLQCACAWQQIRHGRTTRTLVSVLGWSGQAKGVVLTAAIDRISDEIQQSTSSS